MGQAEHVLGGEIAVAVDAQPGGGPLGEQGLSSVDVARRQGGDVPVHGRIPAPVSMNRKSADSRRLSVPSRRRNPIGPASRAMSAARGGPWHGTVRTEPRECSEIVVDPSAPAVTSVDSRRSSGIRRMTRACSLIVPSDAVIVATSR